LSSGLITTRGHAEKRDKKYNNEQVEIPIKPVNKCIETIRYCYLVFCRKCGWAKHIIPARTEVSIGVAIMKKERCGNGCRGKLYIQNANEKNTYDPIMKEK
jgi:hypothetical protein